MSIKKKSPGGNLTMLTQSLSTMIKNEGDDLATSNQAAAICSLESLAPDQVDALDQHITSIEGRIATLVTESLGIEAFDDTTVLGRRVKENGLKAGAIVAQAHGNPVGYATQAYQGKATAGNGVILGEVLTAGAGGRLDYRDVLGLESFDEREIREFLPYSIAFNVLASRQDDFNETLFPTIVVTPDQAGLDVSLNRPLVFQEVRHAISGQPANFNKRNLTDAAVDHTILGDETTRLIPVRLPDGSNKNYFVDPAVVGGTNLLLSGVSIPTAPLAVGNEVDLLGISQFPALIGAGIIDNTDSVDGRINVENLYLQVDAGEFGIKFPTKFLPRNNFVKSQEGNGREMNLVFKTQDLVLNAATLAVDGSVPTNAALALIRTGGYTVRLAVSITGDANVEFGNISVNTGPVKVASIQTADGDEVALDKGDGLTIATAVAAMKIVGYDLHVNRTNLNRRTRGHLLDTTWEVQRFPISLGSPLSIPAPASSTKDAADLKTLINAARTRNSSNGITTVFNVAEMLAAHANGPQLPEGVIPNISGMGRFLVRPFWEHRELDVLKAINNLKSLDRMADIRGVFNTFISDIFYRMYRDSRIQPAIDAVDGTSGVKPTLFIGTDQVIEEFIMTTGDTRTFGPGFDKFEIKSTVDKRMRNKIILTFIRPNVSGPDPLSFGNHAWIPELTSAIMVNRNGATIKEAMVQPRTLHINHLPILAVIDVKNLTAAMAQKVDTPHVGDAIGQGNLDGINYP